MLSLPKRPGPYLLTFLLIILGLICLWMFQAVTNPAVTRAAQQSQRKIRPPEPSDPLPVAASVRSASAVSTAIDPVVLDMHQQFTAPETSPEQEMEIIQELMSLDQKALSASGYGDNSDITRSLLGDGPQGLWLPRNSPRIRDGQLLDRWGTPYWFHANSGSQIEIRSAGPDKGLFTPDDVILNPSPTGFGATQ